MTAIRLDGKVASAAIKEELRERVGKLRELGVTPGLGTVLVGDDPGSQLYVAGKHRDCAEVGIESIKVELPATATQEEVEAAIDRLNADPACTGYILQLPLPKHIDQDAVIERIAPEKDADGLHPMNLGRLVLNAKDPILTPLPCTPRGCIELLERNGIGLDGKHVVVIGRGVTVGRSIGSLLTRHEYNATVTLTHTGTPDIGAIARTADIIIAAAGSASLVKPDWVKPGAAVLDVGVSRIEDPETGKSKVRGDVDPAVWEVAGHVSPNPGGVGPMTRALLLANVVETAERQASARA